MNYLNLAGSYVSSAGNYMNLVGSTVLKASNPRLLTVATLGFLSQSSVGLEYLNINRSDVRVLRVLNVFFTTLSTAVLFYQTAIQTPKALIAYSIISLIGIYPLFAGESNTLCGLVQLVSRITNAASLVLTGIQLGTLSPFIACGVGVGLFFYNVIPLLERNRGPFASLS